ncbi:MAG: hypothetical protein LQ340_003772 [Diploschistes diacapsis]|nr:MAG: hypothetical protein LQ340_003772 [Diploschistes diacapsis]
MAPSAAPRPLSLRRLDTVYTVWFALHLLIMFCVDLTTIYPDWLTPAPLVALRTWQVQTYHDRFFVDPPAWFRSFVWMEAGYHVPLSIWAVGALIQDSPLVPVHLLIWAVQTALTTLVCIVDYSSWEDFSAEEKTSMNGLYVPYLLLAIGMGLDMFFRLRSRLLEGSTAVRAKGD